MKKLYAIMLLALIAHSQAIFTMDDDQQKDVAKMVITKFVEVSGRIQTIQDEPHSGPVTRATITELMTNQVLIERMSPTKQQQLLYARNQELFTQVTSINFSKNRAFFG